MAQHYHTLEQKIGPESSHRLFLCIDDASLRSLLAAPPHLAGFSGHVISYVSAIRATLGIKETHDDGEDEDDMHDEPSMFNVAVESLAKSLFPTVAQQTLNFRELAVGMNVDDIVLGSVLRRKVHPRLL